MTDADEEFDKARQKSQGRFRSAFEAIFAKYGVLDKQDDVIDLSTGELIVDNGRMRAAKVVVLGDLLKYPDSPTLDQGDSRKRRYLSPELDEYYTQSSSSLSPELGPINDCFDQIDATRLKPDDSDGSSESEGESLDLEFFAPYRTLLEQERRKNADSNHINKHRQHFQTRERFLRTSYESDSDAESAINAYESSDSLGAENEAPIDSYFTSSIEKYLEKLRRQLSTPLDLNSVEVASPIDDPVEQQTWRISENLNTSDTQEGPGYLLNSYRINSSPRTDFEYYGSSNEFSGDYNDSIISETPSEPSSIYSDEESMSSIMSTESIIDLQQGQQQQRYSTDHIYSSDVEEERIQNYIPYGREQIQQRQNSDYSEEEEIPFTEYSNEQNLHREAFSDISPHLHSLHHGIVYSSNQPTSLPPRPQLAENGWNDNERHIADHASTMLSHNQQAYENTRIPAIPLEQSSAIPYAPIVLKPKPVAPHIFFDFQGKSHCTYDDYIESE